MHINSLLLAASVSSLAAAETIKVLVGKGGDVFEPATITAKAGDKVEFVWDAADPVPHNVVQSSFEAPCTPQANGFFNQPISASAATFTIDVKNSDPVYYYCSVGNHCNVGMVGIINPVQGKTIDQMYASARSAKASQPQGSTPVGGVQSAAGAAASSSGTPSSSASGTAAAKSSSSASAGEAKVRAPRALAKFAMFAGVAAAAI